jgi:hypothetical protein
MRQHSRAADLPKPPHLVKETAAAGACGGAAARPEETAAAPAGHLMQESAMEMESGERAGGFLLWKRETKGVTSRLERGRVGALSGVSKAGLRNRCDATRRPTGSS